VRISNLKLGIGIPNNFPMVPSAFFDSFICMEKPDYVFLRSSFGPIEEMRNNIVRDALLQGCTHLILMDTDQVYPVDTITRLLSHRLPVVGCLLFRRYPPFDPLMLTGEVTKYSTVTEWKDGELVEVDATGTGCVLYDMEVFTRIPDPHSLTAFPITCVWITFKFLSVIMSSISVIVKFASMPYISRTF